MRCAIRFLNGSYGYATGAKVELAGIPRHFENRGSVKDLVYSIKHSKIDFVLTKLLFYNIAEIDEEDKHIKTCKIKIIEKKKKRINECYRRLVFAKKTLPT